jgi:acyl-CoA dehydrogenase
MITYMILYVDFALSPEQHLIRETMRSFVAAECPRDVVREADAAERFPRELWSRLAPTGMLGVAVPEDQGGAKSGVLEQVLIAEELARGPVALAVAFINTACLGASVLTQLAPAATAEPLIARLLAGNLILSFAWTEADSGSDVLAMRSKAVRAADGYVATGAKMFITLAAEADCVFTVLRTSTDAKRRSDGFSCLMLDTSDPGVQTRRLGKAGQKSAPFGEVHFSDLAVPADRLVGTEGRALQEIGPVLSFERILFSAICVGIARQALADAVAYALERTAFGRPIGQFQAVQHHLAEMTATIESASLLTYRAAWLHDSGQDAGTAGTLAFLAASTAAGDVTDRGMQVLGGAGYSTEFDMERYWRDARAFRLAPVTSEVARGLVARSLGMPRSY